MRGASSRQVLPRPALEVPTRENYLLIGLESGSQMYICVACTKMKVEVIKKGIVWQG